VIRFHLVIVQCCLSTFANVDVVNIEKNSYTYFLKGQLYRIVRTTTSPFPCCARHVRSWRGRPGPALPPVDVELGEKRDTGSLRRTTTATTLRSPPYQTASALSLTHSCAPSNTEKRGESARALDIFAQLSEESLSFWPSCFSSSAAKPASLSEVVPRRRRQQEKCVILSRFRCRRGRRRRRPTTRPVLFSRGPSRPS